MCTTICSRYTENQIKGEGYHHAIWEDKPKVHRNANEQLFCFLTTSLAATALVFIGNIHNEVMDTKKDFTWYQRIGCVLLLNIACVFVIPIALIDIIAHTFIHLPIALLLSLYNWHNESVHFAVGTIIIGAANIFYSLYTMYQLTTYITNVQYPKEG